MTDKVLIGDEDGDIPCDRCAGTGNLIKDWDRYVSAKTTEEIEDCESDCPDCSGYGRFKAETPSPETNSQGFDKAIEQALGIVEREAAKWLPGGPVDVKGILRGISDQLRALAAEGQE